MNNNPKEGFFDTPAVEIPCQRVAPDSLAADMNIVEFQTLFCRQAVIKHLDALEDGLNDQDVHESILNGLIGGFIDTSIALLSANRGMADRHLLELFGEKFGETSVKILNKARERNVAEMCERIFADKLGAEKFGAESLSEVLLTKAPPDNQESDDWEDYNSRPTSPYSIDLAARIQRYIAAEQELISTNTTAKPRRPTAGGTSHEPQSDAPVLYPIQHSLSPSNLDSNPQNRHADGTKHTSNAKKQIAAITTLIGAGALVVAGLLNQVSQNKNTGNKNKMDLPAESIATAGTLSHQPSSKPKKIPAQPAQVPPLTVNGNETITCRAKPASSAFENYLEAVYVGNPQLAEMLDKSFRSAVIEGVSNPEKDKVELLESILLDIREDNDDRIQMGNRENINQFVQIHLAALADYKKTGIWRGGREQTRLLYEKLHLDCQSSVNKQ